MYNPRTERVNPSTIDIDTWPVAKILAVMNAEDRKVPEAVAMQLSAIEQAVLWTIRSLSAGGRLFYAGSGSSGRLGVLDAAELEPTFGVLGGRVIPLMAGGLTAIFSPVEGAEDDEALGRLEGKKHNVCANDIIIGIASSGNTPFVVGALKEARLRGATTVAIVGDDSGCVSANADLTIVVDVGPEVVAGSTRLKNGTAQKLILNMISSATMIALGRTYSNLMAGTSPRNAKLAKRARRILVAATHKTEHEAEKTLAESEGGLDTALVSLLTGLGAPNAKLALDSHRGAIRTTIEAILERSLEAHDFAGATARRCHEVMPHALGLDSTRIEAAFAVVGRAVGDGEGEIPGAVAAVVRDGRTIIRAYGLACRQPNYIGMSPSSIFDLASLTKVMATAPSVMILCERGYFRLDDPLCLFIPGFGGGGKEHISIRQLLTHTAGLPAHLHFWSMGLLQEEIIDHICGLTLDASAVLGQRVLYTDLGYMMLGELVKDISGENLADFARKNIFDPLGMCDTSFVPPKSSLSRIAATEYRSDLGKLMWGEVHDENAYAMGGIAGHAGLFGTAGDVAKYAAMWLGKGKVGGTTVLSANTVRVATSAHTPSDERRGLGWSLPSHIFSSGGDLISRQAFGHTGFTGTSLWCDPDSDIGIILLTNRVHAGRDSQVIAPLRARFANSVLAAVSGSIRANGR